MPWRTTPEERIRFVALARRERFTLTELCKQFGISRLYAPECYEEVALFAFKVYPEM
jgi:transposase-like protein